MTKAEWRAATKPIGWRRLLPFTIYRVNDGIRVRIAWKQAALTLVVLVLMAWVGGATSAYLFVKYRRNFPEVKLTHMLFYPSQQQAYRTARGDYLVREAQKDLEDQKVREAFNKVRMGAALSPGNREGRLLLAQFYSVWGRADLAQSTLLDGMEAHEGNMEYLKTVFSFLLQRQEDFEVIKITDRLLAREDPSAVPARTQLIGTARASALFFRGDYDAAEDALRTYRLQDSVDGKLLGIRVDWERGERDLALARLDELSAEAPENEEVYGQYSAYLREAERVDELRRLALLRQLSYPDRPRPRIDLLYIQDRAKDEARVQTGITELFRDFSNNGEVMLALADFAANTGRPLLARRIYDHCKATNLPWEGAALMTVEAHIVAKEYREALDATAEMQKDNPEWGKRFAFVFNGLQAIAKFGLADNEAAQIFLTNFLNQAGVRADNLVAVSNRLVSIGASDAARQVLAQAVRADALNQTALTGLIRLDLASERADSASIHLRALLKMRKPPLPLLREAYAKLGSDLFLLTPGRASLLNDMRATLTANPAPAAAG